MRPLRGVMGIGCPIFIDMQLQPILLQPILKVMEDFSPIGHIGGIPADAGRRQDRGQRGPAKRSSGETASPSRESGDDYLPGNIEEPPSPLVEALDRLRATGNLGPSEETTRRILRGQRYYQERQPQAAPPDEAEAGSA
jgi:hypothetical protein